MNDTQLRPDTLITIGCLNRSTLISKQDWAPMIGLVNYQLADDFGPRWEIWGALAEVETFEDLAKYKAKMIIQDDVPSAPPGILGYHDELGTGELVSYVGVRPVLEFGGVSLIDYNDLQRPSIASVMSHEGIELLVDPTVNSVRMGPLVQQGAFYMMEACDAVEAWQYKKTLPSGEEGVVSDFVLPNYFDPSTPDGTQVDYLGMCPGAFQLAPGGYMTVIGPDYKFNQITAPGRRRPWKDKGQITSVRSLVRAARMRHG